MSEDDKVIYCDFCDESNPWTGMYYKDKSMSCDSDPNCCATCIEQFSDSDSDDEGNMDDMEQIPWCYADDKNSVCGCSQPCALPSPYNSDDEDSDEEEEEE